MKTLLLILAMVALLVGCGRNPDHYDLYISPAFTHDQQNDVVDAALKWETVVPVTFSIHIGDFDCDGGAGHDNICVRPGLKAQMVATYNKTDIVGHNADYGHDDEKVEIAIDDSRIKSHARFQEAIMHELGHSMGLEHDVSGTLMAPGMGHAALEPTCRDQKQWHSVRGQHFACWE